MPQSGSAPRVSVIVPTRDRASLLPHAVASVLAQTVGDLECIVVDDGSTDDTAALRATFTDQRVVWVDGDGRGVAAARNRATALARGTWVAFLDDDNRWRPEYLQRLLDAARRAGADVAACLAVDVGPDGVQHSSPPPPSRDPVAAAAAGWFPLTSCIVVRREALVATGGFPEEFHHGEDVHVWAALALSARWVVLPEVLMERHRHGHPRLTDDWPEYRRAAAALDRRFGRAVQRRAGLRVAARWHWRYVGRFEFIRMMDEASGSGRRSAARSLGRQVRALPRAVASIGRPALVLVVGRDRYWRIWHQYDRAHQRHAHRLRPRRDR